VIRIAQNSIEVNDAVELAVVRESLSSLKTRLDGSRFLRVRRRVIVNLAQIHQVLTDSEEGSSLTLRDGTKGPISRRLRARVAKALDQFRACSVGLYENLI
jgi:DNA-binding LytR/AlgR family response regulator